MITENEVRGEPSINTLTPRPPPFEYPFSLLHSGPLHLSADRRNPLAERYGDHHILRQHRQHQLFNQPADLSDHSAAANLHDLDNARTQASERFIALQDVTFELERSQVSLLRATGDLESWARGTK